MWPGRRWTRSRRIADNFQSSRSSRNIYVNAQRLTANDSPRLNDSCYTQGHDLRFRSPHFFSIELRFAYVALVRGAKLAGVVDRVALATNVARGTLEAKLQKAQFSR
jgi:hypothetical protein